MIYNLFFFLKKSSITNKDTDFGEHESVLLGHQLPLIGYNMSLWDYKKVILKA